MKNIAMTILSASLVLAFDVGSASAESAHAGLKTVERGRSLEIRASSPRPRGEWCGNDPLGIITWGGDGWTCWAAASVDDSGGCADEDGNTWSEPNPC